MANATVNSTNEFNIARVLSAPFRAIWNGLISVAEASSAVQEMNRLNTISDERLEELGTNRAAELRRIVTRYSAV